MRIHTFTTLLGIFLILIGLFMMYKGFTYTTQEKMIQIGNLQLVSEHHKTILFSPYLGGFTFAVGIILLILGRIKK